jgi:hypothetical protein
MGAEGTVSGGYSDDGIGTEVVACTQWGFVQELVVLGKVAFLDSKSVVKLKADNKVSQGETGG